MTLSEVKEAILTNTLSDNLLIFKCTDSTFIANQYIAELSNRTGKEINNINSILEPQSSALSLVFSYEERINILRTEEFSELIEDYDSLKNIIVVCTKIDKKIETALKSYIVEVPKAPDWAVVDYMKLLCPELNDSERSWLYKVTDGSIDRIVNELSKLQALPHDQRQTFFEEMRAEPSTDLYSLPLFELTSAVLKKDLKKVFEWQKHRNTVKFDPIAVTSILLQTYKKIMYLNYGSGLTPAVLNISNGEASHIKKDYLMYTKNQIAKNIEFLTNIDNRLKNNRLEMSPECMLVYIIARILTN